LTSILIHTKPFTDYLYLLIEFPLKDRPVLGEMLAISGKRLNCADTNDSFGFECSLISFLCFTWVWENELINLNVLHLTLL